MRKYGIRKVFGVELVVRRVGDGELATGNEDARRPVVQINNTTSEPWNRRSQSGPIMLTRIASRPRYSHSSNLLRKFVSTNAAAATPIRQTQKEIVTPLTKLLLDSIKVRAIRAIQSRTARCPLKRVLTRLLGHRPNFRPPIYAFLSCAPRTWLLHEG